MKHKIAGRAAFHEHAEALGITTEQVISYRPHPEREGRIHCLFRDGEEVWGAELERDGRGILREIKRTKMERDA